MRTIFSIARLTSLPLPKRDPLKAFVVGLDVQKDLHAFSGCFIAGILDDRLHHFREVEIILALALAAFQFRQSQKFAHHFIQLGRLPADAVERCRQLGGVLPRQTDRQIEPRQRRTQFMGNVGQKPVARGHQFLQPHRHLVEIMGQIGDLVAPPAHRRAQPGGEIALGQAPEARPACAGSAGSGTRPGWR